MQDDNNVLKLRKHSNCADDETNQTCVCGQDRNHTHTREDQWSPTQERFYFPNTHMYLAIAAQDGDDDDDNSNED